MRTWDSGVTWGLGIMGYLGVGFHLKHCGGQASCLLGSGQRFLDMVHCFLGVCLQNTETRFQSGSFIDVIKQASS